MSIRIYGNRLIKTLPGLETRPTAGKVRTALFNIWQNTIVNCKWLDLCAGSGAMGAEALCRKASLVVGIDKSPKVCSMIQENWQHIAHSEQKFQVIKGDVITKIKSLNQKFDKIYFDPPYASNLYQPVLEAIAVYQLLNEGGEIAVEHNPNLPINPLDGLVITKHKVYGHTALTFLGTEKF